MIQSPIVTQWKLFTPTVYRILKREYVVSFFDTGELHVSTFANFSKHPDEQRNDKKEGNNVLVGRGKNKTFYALTVSGSDAYVLCGTTIKPDNDYLAKNNLAAIQIFDTTGFGSNLSSYIPGTRYGIEGYCIYSDGGIEYKLSDLDEEKLRINPDDNVLSLNELGGFIQNMAGQAIFYHKRAKFRPDSEYRWVWVSNDQKEDGLMINVPDARDFCLPCYPE